MREEAETGKRGGTGELCVFFTKEKRKLRYIFGGLDSNTKPRKLIRSRRSTQEAGEATPDGIGSKQSRPLDGEIERRRTFEVTWTVFLVENPSHSIELNVAPNQNLNPTQLQTSNWALLN
jgi:hypothetical protein